MTLIPLRGGAQGLSLSYDLEALLDAQPNLNAVLETVWAGLLHVVSERWPDWPVEVWTRVAGGPDADGEGSDDGERGDGGAWQLQFRVFFGGDGSMDSKEVQTMVSFVLRALRLRLGADPELGWGGISDSWHPLWAVDDESVYRLLAPEATVEPSVYQLGHYGGEPAWFAATLEAWPLRNAEAPIELAEADTAWAFDH
jgi:hypothetical protein